MAKCATEYKTNLGGMFLPHVLGYPPAMSE